MFCIKVIHEKVVISVRIKPSLTKAEKTRDNPEMSAFHCDPVTWCPSDLVPGEWVWWLWPPVLWLSPTFCCSFPVDCWHKQPWVTIKLHCSTTQHCWQNEKRVQKYSNTTYYYSSQTEILTFRFSLNSRLKKFVCQSLLQLSVCPNPCKYGELGLSLMVWQECQNSNEYTDYTAANTNRPRHPHPKRWSWISREFNNPTG